MAKRGRPLIEDPRNKHCLIRINDKENSILKECCKLTGMKQADVFRTALERMYKEEKFKDDHPLSPSLNERRKK